jgi:hypothetical protein
MSDKLQFVVCLPKTVDGMQTTNQSLSDIGLR